MWLKGLKKRKVSLQIEFNRELFTGKKRALFNNSEITIRAARMTDTSQLACFLRSIQITPENVEAKLSPAHPESFKNKGGFFVVWSAEDLSRILQDEKNLVLVALCNEQGKEEICGFLWCRLALDSIAVTDWQPAEEALGAGRIDMKRYFWALKNDLIFTAVECAVAPNGYGVGICHWLNYEIYYWLWEKGYLYSVLQVYCIRGEYRADGSFAGTDLPNEASINNVRKYGAVLIKEASVPDQRVGKRKIKVSAHVFLLDLHAALHSIEGLIKESIREKEGCFGTGGCI